VNHEDPDGTSMDNPCIDAKMRSGESFDRAFVECMAAAGVPVYNVPGLTAVSQPLLIDPATFARNGIGPRSGAADGPPSSTEESPWWVVILASGNGRTPQQRKECAVAGLTAAASGFGDLLFLMGINDAYYVYRGTRPAAQSAMSLVAKNVPGQLAERAALGNRAMVGALKLSGRGVTQNVALTVLEGGTGWKGVPLVGTAIRWTELWDACDLKLPWF
jgi:hypothetical protein